MVWTVLVSTGAFVAVMLYVIYKFSSKSTKTMGLGDNQ
jgi:hypothetical protein